MAECSQTNVPVLNQNPEPCNGVYTPTTCIVNVGALTALGTPANSLLSDILTALVAALNTQSIAIENLTTQVTNQQIQIDALQAQIDDCCQTEE
jgi:hypothetical protein